MALHRAPRPEPAKVRAWKPSPTGTSSLLRHLLLWLVVPLVLLLALNAFLSYRAALAAANDAYDRLLLASMRAIADRVAVVENEVRVDVPYVALELFESKSQERIFYRVATGSGETVTGYEDLPLPPASRSTTQDEPVFYRATYHDDTVYLGALSKPLYDADVKGPVTVVVAETAEGRDALSRRILADSVSRQGLLILVAALVVWLGLRQGLRPMLQLSDAIARRADTDLTPIAGAGVQREVRPLIDALNQHTARLDRLIAARRRFLDDASHQLRTPLAALKMQAEYGLAGDDAADRRVLLADMHRTTDETIRLVNQLLLLARAEPQGIAGRDIEALDLASLARDTTAELVPAARQKRIDLGFEGPTNPCLVRGNRVLLHELVVNLVDNAIRYTPEGGTVTVRVRPGAGDGVGQSPERPADAGAGCGAVTLQVEDNGPGIPADEREQVFERFYRGKTAAGPGSGLGLAIVQDICGSHRATIALGTPHCGTGLCVTVQFPEAEIPSQ